MRNVQQLSAQYAAAAVGEDEVLLPFLATCPLNGTAFVISSTLVLYAIDMETNKERLSLPLVCDSLLEAGSTVTGLAYVVDMEAVCVTTLEGDIVVVQVEDLTAEVVGSLDSGIAAMAWSPDYELVVFVTCSRSIVEMTSMWEMVAEVPVQGEQKREAGKEKKDGESLIVSLPPLEGKDVDLSWRGDGKCFAVSLPVASSASPLYEVQVYDRACVYESRSVPAEVKYMKRPEIAWRPSGSVIAGSQRQPHRLEVMFFERNGLRHGEFTVVEGGAEETTEVTGLGWNASSDLLALLVIASDGSSRVQVWHMNNYHWYWKVELQRGARGTREEIVNLAWDAEVGGRLTLCLAGGEIECHELYWDVDVRPGLSAANDGTVAVLDGSKVLLTPVRHLVPPPPMSAAQIALIGSEGGRAMANRICFSPDGDMLLLLSDGSLNLYTAGEPGEDELPGEATPVLEAEISLDSMVDGHRLFQVQYVGEDLVAGISVTAEAPGEASLCSLVVLRVTLRGDRGRAELVGEMVIPGRPLRLYHNQDTHKTLISLADKTILAVSLVDEGEDAGVRVTSDVAASLPVTCNEIASVIFGGEGEGEGGEEEVIVGFNRRAGRLIVGGVECSRECSSFAVHDQFLLFTTLSCSLRFISTSSAFSAAALDTAEVHAHDICTRRVETGSRLVAVVPHSSRVILQMPRGNLELIYPRALLLAACKKLLRASRYGDAFREMRRHRVDLNLLCDYEPERFVASLEDIVRQVGDVTHLNLFVSALKEHDVTKTLFVSREVEKRKQELPSYLMTEEELQYLYYGYGGKSQADTRGATVTSRKAGVDEVEEEKEREAEKAKVVGRATKKESSKVNRICEALRKALAAVDEEKYLLTILTTYVKQEPPRLAQVLRIVQSLRSDSDDGKQRVTRVDASTVEEKENEMNGEGGGKAERKPTAEAALDYLVFLVDVQELYRVALGLYDFRLAVLVAQKSQMDPKEYLPDLQTLAALQPPALRKATIDERLGRWEGALRHLASLCDEGDVESSAFVTCQRLLREHPELYRLASSSALFAAPACLAAVRKAHGEELCERTQYDDAAELFWLAGEGDRAVEVYARHTANWRLALCRAQEMGKSEEEVRELAEEIAATYGNLARFEEAARILLDYCGKAEEAVRSLVAGCLWEEAQRVMQMKRQELPEGLSESLLLPALLQAHESMTALVATKHEAYRDMADRLTALKRIKILNPVPMHLADTGAPGGDGVFSDTSSFASSMSSFSYVSMSSGGTRRRKKKKKKRITGKVGSRYEEEYLVQNLRQAVPSAERQREVGRLLRGLMGVNRVEEARTLQAAYAEFLSCVEASLPLLLAPIIGVPGEEEENALMEKKVEDKRRLDALFSAAEWKLATV